LVKNLLKKVLIGTYLRNCSRASLVVSWFWSARADGSKMGGFLNTYGQARYAMVTLVERRLIQFGLCKTTIWTLNLRFFPTFFYPLKILSRYH